MSISKALNDVTKAVEQFLRADGSKQAINEHTSYVGTNWPEWEKYELAYQLNGDLYCFFGTVNAHGHSGFFAEAMSLGLPRASGALDFTNANVLDVIIELVADQYRLDPSDLSDSISDTDLSSRIAAFCAKNKQVYDEYYESIDLEDDLNQLVQSFDFPLNKTDTKKFAGVFWKLVDGVTGEFAKERAQEFVECYIDFDTIEALRKKKRKSA